MRIVDGGSRAPTFWSFVLATITLSPVEQQRHWLEDTVCLELTRYKDVSIVSISKISEVIVPTVQPWCCETCSYPTTVLNERMWHFKGIKHTLTLPTYFQGVRTSLPLGSTPLVNLHPRCRRSIIGRTAYEPWSMRIVNDGSPAPMFWSFFYWAMIT